ncbi:hypothetical protein DBP19_35190 [Streptomyces sp. CS090A]|uniref:hypothetical protein n=1 Tax=Streptomyces sp. CS090A TaxID=2162710 RepID=UPI000D51CA2D|nr:hypothetical protein [Streptomyces sp. CS090A]PVC80751.1 hypothetical protein DBP19_35190 [Streptomyces sp. CS090A]
MVSDQRDDNIDWASVLRADFTREVEGLQQYAYAADARRDVVLQRDYLHQISQLEALPKPWEGDARLTVDEYAAAVRLRAWVLHEQEIAADRQWARKRGMSERECERREADFRARKRYHCTPNGQMLCAVLRDDGRIALNSEILAPEVADRLRQQMPQFADLITFYFDNQEAGRGLQGAPIDRTPLPGPSSSSLEPPMPDGTPVTAPPGARDGMPQRTTAPAKRRRPRWRRFCP